MKLEVFSQSKYKTGNILGDDVVLEMPNMVYGVFDGATDPHNSQIDGISVGRIAAMTAASEVLNLVNSNIVSEKTPLSDILDSSRAALEQTFNLHDIKSIPSTTAALAFEFDDCFRLILVGDSSIRINGNIIYTKKKIVDCITTFSRITVFKYLRNTLQLNGDEIEHLVRRISFLGFDLAIKEGVLTKDFVCNTIKLTASNVGIDKNLSEVSELLSNGIQSQYQYINNSSHVFGYAALNSKSILYRDIVDISISKDNINSIEIFSDGYSNPPQNSINVASWEREFDLVERCDFNKIDGYPSIKGSTTNQFSDDRAILSLSKI